MRRITHGSRLDLLWLRVRDGAANTNKQLLLRLPPSRQTPGAGNSRAATGAAVLQTLLSGAERVSKRVTKADAQRRHRAGVRFKQALGHVRLKSTVTHTRANYEPSAAHSLRHPRYAARRPPAPSVCSCLRYPTVQHSPRQSRSEWEHFCAQLTCPWL